MKGELGILVESVFDNLLSGRAAYAGANVELLEGRPAYEIELGPICVLSLNRKAIIIMILKDLAGTCRLFEFFQPFYLFIRKFYKILKIMTDSSDQKYLKTYHELISEEIPKPAEKAKCKLCCDTGICYECSGLGEVETDTGDLKTCPICKGIGSCFCERAD